MPHIPREGTDHVRGKREAPLRHDLRRSHRPMLGRQTLIGRAPRHHERHEETRVKRQKQLIHDYQKPLGQRRRAGACETRGEAQDERVERDQNPASHKARVRPKDGHTRGTPTLSTGGEPSKRRRRREAERGGAKRGRVTSEGGRMPHGMQPPRAARRSEAEARRRRGGGSDGRTRVRCPVHAAKSDATGVVTDGFAVGGGPYERQGGHEAERSEWQGR